MGKYDGWVIKNKRGSLLFWTFGRTKREAKEKVRESKGHELIKVKFVEVK